MKITLTILAVATAFCLGQRARADDSSNAPLNFAVVQDPHGGNHFMYYQTDATVDSTTVALNTASGGVESGTFNTRVSPLPSNGEVKFVTGTNQHGEPSSAYIPTSSNFAQGQQ